MTLDERVAHMEQTVDQLVSIQERSLDLLGLSVEGQRRIAERTARLESTVQEMGDKLNGLIDVVDGFIRGRKQ